MFSFFIAIAILQGAYLNMSPKGLISLETRMKVSSPNSYNFKKQPSVLAQTIGSSHNGAYFKNVLLTISTVVWCKKAGAQLGCFKGRGFVVEIGHKDIGFPIETFRAIV